ncbi:anthranilate phosphoribosyltransferase [Chondrinema litorale]|uniref:anthranilate phosphoribosyltransferase n=1 Tax=Chondrinema litorale TaxID=2994555 RepID=UPI002544831A|nr:anthranilate phosphoribosyltransferase [Chondrinema litorale]UZR92718.1 anthranilate phosphoribosyltransferase [Chondrinema litorale]
MKEILNHLFEYKTLSRDEAKEILSKLAQGEYNNSQVAAFITVYLMRNITVSELEGFRDAMLELCVPVEFDGFDVIDLCGTGGDGKNTFNISTLASFISAGAGVKVAKHGNYGVSSVSGSSNVLEYFGHKFTNNIDALKKQMDESNICFLHAPLFHPAMKNVAPIRRELGVKTFFNMLGPIVNPAKPQAQMVGVFSLELQRLYGYLYQQTNKRFSIVHALDGYDEVSLTGDFKMITNQEEAILSPSVFHMDKLKQEEIFGGDSIDEAAGIFKKVISNEGTKAQTSVVIANAALAIQCYKQISLDEAIDQAKESLESGKALQVFKQLTNQ